MTSTYILSLAILVFGGLIASLGDRLGTRVGKARLRLFNLRPRQTAMIITVIAGTLISASTLGILLLLSESLRDGLFQLDNIKRDLRKANKELTKANEEKQEIATKLITVNEQQTQAAEKLALTQQDFQKSNQRLLATSKQAQGLRNELNTLLAERSKSIEQLSSLKKQSKGLQTQLKDQNQSITTKEASINKLQKEQSRLQTQIGNRDLRIDKLDKAIANKNRDLQTRKNRLHELESQLKFVQKEVAVLEEYYQTYQELRERKIAIVKGEVLASATIRVVESKAVFPAIDRLLGQANRNVIKSTLLNDQKFKKHRVVNITTAQVQQLAKQIEDGQDYVVRILSAGNYVQGEKEIRVFADTTPNKEVFKAGESIATVSIDSQELNQKDIQERLDWLLAASKFRAQRAGIIGDLQIGDGQIVTIINFINDVAQSEQAQGEIKAVVSETTYTAGPLKLNLVVVKNGVVILST